MKRSDGIVAFVLLSVWGLLFAAIDVRGQFPLNDDFTYAQAVRRWMQDGVLRLSQTALAPDLPAIWIARVWSIVFGSGNGSLRLSILVWGAAVILMFYLYLRQAGHSLRLALIASALLAFNPIFMTMSACFHSDVPGLFFLIAALASFDQADRVGLGGYIGASLFMGLGTLTRPYAAVGLIGLLLAAWSQRVLTKRSAAALLLPFLMLVLPFLWWLFRIHGLNWAWTSSSFFSWRHQSHGTINAVATIGQITSRLHAVLGTLALFLAPLTLALARRRWSSASSFSRWLATIVAGLIGIGIVMRGGFPLLGNTLHRHGLGVLTLNAPEFKSAGWWGAPTMWFVIGLLAALSAGAMTLLFDRHPTRRSLTQAQTAVWVSILSYAPLLFLTTHYDRYLLVLLPAAIVVILVFLKEEDFDFRQAVFGCLLMAAFATVGLSDYFAWNRARWEAGQAAIAHGVPPEKIENGFDWDGELTLEKNFATLLAQRAPSTINYWDWMTLNRVVMATSFSHNPPLAGFVPVQSFPYRSPLVMRGAHIWLHGDAKVFRVQRGTVSPRGTTTIPDESTK